MQLDNHQGFKGRSASIAGRSLLVLGLALAVGACSEENDELRGTIPETGVAAAVHIDLPEGSQQAQVVATVYENAVAQPLVGGDVLQARADQSVTTLRALENLSGHYTGALFVDHPDTPIEVAVNYDTEASAADRWFGSDDLLVAPGPGSLVGYRVTGMQFPATLALESPAQAGRYSTRADEVEILWMPADQGDQVRMNAAVACHYPERTIHYAVSRNLGMEGQDESAAGRYRMMIDDFVEVSPFVASLAIIEEYVSVFVTAILLGADPQTLLNGDNPLSSPGQINSCDIDVTLIRERANPLPPAFSGGYAITSRSDTVRIVYAPE